MERLLEIQLLNMAIHAIAEIHTIIVSLGHLVK
jgi:hypothetical protein